MRAVKWLWRAYIAATAALRGHDNRLSFSKLILVAVLARGHGLNPVVAVACLAASFGVRAFTAYLCRSTFTLASTDTHTETVTRAAEHKILERRNGEYEETP